MKNEPPKIWLDSKNNPTKIVAKKAALSQRTAAALARNASCLINFPPNWRLENLYNLVGQDSAEMVHKSSGCGNEMFVQHESTSLACGREAGVAAITITKYQTVTQLRHPALDFPK